MSLSPGTRLGEVEILELVGAGGMGDVYRARDTRLGREVAVKVVSDAVAVSERRHRFAREARLLASLNHPHVATLHGFFEHERTSFLVMELVPGETLDERLARGRLSVTECVKLFSQIARGLAAAHEKGIIHRDLKPSNIKVTPDGRAKVLDFGLAKGLADDEPVEDVHESPTRSAPATRAGVILGTASYMSPEQARGQALDRRTDVWSFGAVLYEALSGRKLFDGKTVTDVLAAIVHQEPDWDALRKDTPWRMRDLLRRCLRKDPVNRLDSATAAALDIESALESGSIPESATLPQRTPVVWLLVGTVLGALVAGALLPRRDSGMPTPTRFEVELPLGHFIVGENPGNLDLSRDGRQLVYADGGDEGRLYLRPMDALGADPLPGTENASHPFFSPDGRWIGFFTPGGLKKVSLDEAAVTTIVADVDGFGGVWTGDNAIFFGGVGGTPGLWRVSSDGGVPERLSEGNDFVMFPDALPVAGRILIEVYIDETSSIVAFDTSSGARTTVVENARRAHFVDSGHLVFMRPDDPMLYAVAFDPHRLELAGPAVPLGESLDVTQDAQFAVARNGDLVVRTAGEGAFQIVWVRRDGSAEPITSQAQAYSRPRLAPDGTRLVLSISYRDRARDLFLYDLERASFRRFTFDEGHDSIPVWMPDGSSILFNSTRSGFWNIHIKRTDGSGDAKQLTDVVVPHVGQTIDPDGRKLLFHTANQAAIDIGSLDLKDGTLSLVLATEAVERQPALSPDGRWLAYVSDGSGQAEVYVKRYPSLEGIWQVSEDGGVQPLWSRDGRELFYRNGSRMMSVTVNMSSGFDFSAPELLFDAPYELDEVTNYDIAEDGRFLMIRRDPDVRTRLTVVRGFRQILEEKVPAGE